MQFDFLLNSVRTRKRYIPWKEEKLKNIECVKEYYGYSNEKAKSALKILNDEQIKTIKDSLIKVGKMESVNWTQEQMLEVELKEPDDFLKIRETLSRIALLLEKTKYYINLVTYYINKVNTLSYILKNYLHLMVNKLIYQRMILQDEIQYQDYYDWGLVKIKGETDPAAPLSQIKIISFKDKNDWTLETKYNIGKKTRGLCFGKI